MSAQIPARSMPERPSQGVASLIGFFLAVALGICATFVLFPGWAPGLIGSLFGADPKAYWYLARGAGFVALGLLWASMALGLLITNRVARSWPGAPAAFALHEYVSLLGLAFTVFHALILMGDHYIRYSLVQILIPFGSVSYRPVWVGFGQIGIYVWALVALSFYVRQKIGPKLWRLIHYASFFSFVIAVIHGLGSGTDAPNPWVQDIYWSLGASMLFLVVYRIIAELIPEKRPVPPHRPTAAPKSS